MGLASKILPMKTIKISREIEKELRVFADGQSINKAMRRLLQDVEPVDNSLQLDGFININMDDDLLEMLGHCRIYPDEPYGSVIFRLLQSRGK